MTIDNAAGLLDLAARHRTAVLIGGGLVVAVLLALARVCRHQKGRSAALTFAAAAVALGFSAEGMWEVATKALHLGPGMAILLFAFAEILMLSEASRARKKIAEERSPARHVRAVWIIAVVAGLAAASHADNLSGQVIRAFMPMAVAWQWSSRILDDLPEAVREESRWIWTPRRIGIHLGLLKPGAVDDLSEVFRQRRITALVNAGVKLYAEQQAAKLHAGTEPDGRSWWPRRDRLAAATAKLQRLAKTADKADIADAREQLRLTFSIEQALLGQPSEVDEWTREQLDRTRAEARRAALRSQIALARGHAVLAPRPRTEPMVELGGIRMPAHVAAQIGPGPEPVTEPVTDSPRAAAATHAPAQQRITEPVSTAAQRADDKKIAAAHARLTKRLKREPTGQELGDAAGVSKATANRWKRDNPTTKES
ncbi:hypothetical protein ACWD69_09285 [Micromonospora chokoriensis]